MQQKSPLGSLSVRKLNRCEYPVPLWPAAPLVFDSFLFAKSPKFIDGVVSIGVPFAQQNE
jgi:hypothetical protein